MIYMWITGLITPTLAVAAPLRDWQSVLNYPLEVRVREFRAQSRQTYPFLIKTAKDTNAGLQARWRALTTMGRLDAPAFRAEIENALQSREWFLRNAGLLAVQSDDRDRAVGWSVKLLKDPALMVRTQAVRNLMQLEAREFEPLLWKELNEKRNFNRNESLWIRSHIAEALVRLAPTGPLRVRSFERLLLDSDERLHPWAIKGLERTTGKKITHGKEPLEVRRQKWLSHLGIQAI